jgi:FlaA1/EpsC-like NDP-sugar epimerase
LVGSGLEVPGDQISTVATAHVPHERSDMLRRFIARLRRDVPLALLDAVVIVACYACVLVLRFDGAIPTHYWDSFRVFMPLAVTLHLIANHAAGLYGQMWRYASVQEARRIVVAGVVGGVGVVLANLVAERFMEPLPRSVIFLGPTLALMGAGAIRFQSRLRTVRRSSDLDRTRVLLVGAGDAGAQVLRDIIKHPALRLSPVGFVDDDRRKRGRAIHGVPVLGGTMNIPAVAHKLGVDQILLTIPSADSELVRNVAELADVADVTLRVLPSVNEIMGGKVTARDIRDLKIEDLLGRQQVETDLESVQGILTGRRVLITGAGGSIGSEIVRQVIAFDPSYVVLLDNDETHLHEVTTDLDTRGCSVHTVLADIRDRDRIFNLFSTHKPEVVFHAAAHKHVHLLESDPGEAVLTNILGTANVADASCASSVSRFVLISTDKAIKPSSVMGASKWFAEQIVRSVQWNGCTFCAVRFGNVLGSRGSVIPTFIRQIEKGGPVTVTDPSMARYFMSVSEAVQLVLQASAMARGGEVFTLDMGESVNILALAKKLIRMSGQMPDKDIPIEIVGTRPGEKMVEDIVDTDEEVLPSDHPSIVVSQPAIPDGTVLRSALRDLEGLARDGHTDDLALLMKLLAIRPDGVRKEAIRI